MTTLSLAVFIEHTDSAVNYEYHYFLEVAGKNPLSRSKPLFYSGKIDAAATPA